MTDEYCKDCGCPLDVCCGYKQFGCEQTEKFLKLAKGDKIKAFRLWLNAGNKDNELYQKAKTSNDIEKFICVDCGAIHWFKPIECHNCGKKKFKKIKQVK